MLEVRDDERLDVCRGEAGSDGTHRAEDVEATAALALDLIIEFRQLESTQVKILSPTHLLLKLSQILVSSSETIDYSQKLSLNLLKLSILPRSSLIGSS